MYIIIYINFLFLFLYGCVWVCACVYNFPYAMQCRFFVMILAVSRDSVCLCIHAPVISEVWQWIVSRCLTSPLMCASLAAQTRHKTLSAAQVLGILYFCMERIHENVEWGVSWDIAAQNVHTEGIKHKFIRGVYEEPCRGEISKVVPKVTLRIF